MTLSEIHDELRAGNVVRWRIETQVFRARQVNGVVRVQQLYKEVWLTLDESATLTALEDLFNSRVCLIPPKMGARPVRAKSTERMRDPNRVEARACMDIAWSVRKADRADCPPPTMAAITERPPKLLLGVVDPVTGLPDWRDPADPAHFGSFAYEANSKERALSEVRLTGMAVFEILSVYGFDEAEFRMIDRMYPRRGPYSTGWRPKDGTSRVARIARRAENLLVEWALTRGEK